MNALRGLDAIQPDEREPAGVETTLRRERPHFADGVVFDAIQDDEMGRPFELDGVARPDAALDLIAAFEKAARAIVAVTTHVAVAMDNRYRVAGPCRRTLRRLDRFHCR